ncbi:MAG: heavy metal translocating P-type ATPase [Candidatus Saccharimonadales bacterium]
MKNAQHNHSHSHTDAISKPEELAVCPVMHVTVNKEEAAAHGLVREYQGETYYLCCNHCTEAFDKDPDKYAHDGHKHAHDGAYEPAMGSHDAEHMHSDHGGHDHSAHMMGGKMSRWQKFKMSMTMTMGMDHSGLAGREMAKMMEVDIRNKLIFSLIFTIPIVLYSPLGEKLGIHLPQPLSGSWLSFILATPVFFYAGWLFLYSSYFALKDRVLNMSVLIAVGISAAYISSVYLTLIGSKDTYYDAAAMLITFVLFGHWVEMKSRRGTTDALQALFDLVPPQARLLKNGKEVMVPTSEIQVGDIVVLKPGDKVSVDGEVIQGETSIDEALVTGESLPVNKKAGDPVIGGSINQSGTVQFKATKVGSDTALAQIVKMVETAQNSKAPGQRVADKFAGYLVILAVSSGLITFGVWSLFTNQPFLTVLSFAISAVVIACPDALGLATPTAVAVGTGLGAKHNILIKDAATLEQTSKIQAIVLDKTGTLTEGKPKVTDVVSNGMNEDTLLRYMAAAESASSHPLAQAVLNKATENKLEVPSPSNFNNIAGHGVEAVVDKKKVLVGTERLMRDRKISLAPIQADIDRLLSEGKTLMIAAVNGRAAGVIAAADPAKATAKQTITAMKKLGLEVVMITGDNKQTAAAIAKQLGIERFLAEALPEDKEKYVRKLQSEGKFTAMVGDGVNDAPALARADIGIAIGAGTDVAIGTAKIVLMKSNPEDVLRAIRLSKATVRKMKQNLVWASVYNLAAIPVAAGVLYPAFKISLSPAFAALLMSMSSIFVAVNAVMLKRAEKEMVTV